VEGSDERTKTKIVCTIGPSTSSRDMIWKLAQLGMNVARLNMSHGDHISHQKTIHFVKQYNSQFQDRVISIMLDTKVKLNQFPFLLYNRIAYIINHLHQTHT
jgi:pyruvate kinase